METVVCNLCGHESARPVYEVEDTNYGLPGNFSLVSCQRCGLVYLNPRPTVQEIGAYYPAEQYHPFRALQQKDSFEPAASQRQNADKITQIWGTPTGCHVLDVGCGSGLFLLAMRQNGWQVHGVEPNQQAAEFAQNTLKLPVTIGDIFQVNQEDLFDVVTFWDVLEHTHSPRDVLVQAHALLNPNGLLVINVPNWASLERKLFKRKWIAIDAPRHLYHFSPETITRLLQNCGFYVVEIGSKTPVMNPASNVLRALGARLRNTKKVKPNAKRSLHQVASTRSTSLLKRWLIPTTYILITVPNFVADLLGQGGSLIIYARKGKHNAENYE